MSSFEGYGCACGARAGSVGGVQRSDLRTRDRETVAAALNRIIAHDHRVVFGDPATVEFRHRSVSYGGFGADRIRFVAADYAASVWPTDVLLAGVVLDGAVRAGWRGGSAHATRGDALLWPVGAPYECDFRHPATVTLRVPVAYAARLAEELTGLPAADLRFDGAVAVSQQMRGHWAATVSYLHRQMLGGEEELPPLVVAELLRLTAGTLLAVFPNTTMTAGRVPATGQAAPSVVRRAVAYADGHADQPLTVTEIAAAAGVGPRALQAAFRRHLGTTPMAYLRRVRLEYAHRDLRDADPTTGATVASVARRWGFADPDRFAAAYRLVYAQSPRRTLRT